jgi:hypothetical protein
MWVVQDIVLGSLGLISPTASGCFDDSVEADGDSEARTGSESSVMVPVAVAATSSCWSVI